MNNQPEHKSKPIGDVLRGLEIPELQAGDTPLEVFALVKVLDDTGHASWSLRTTSAANEEELLGALTAQVAV